MWCVLWMDVASIVVLHNDNCVVVTAVDSIAVRAPVGAPVGKLLVVVAAFLLVGALVSPRI